MSSKIEIIFLGGNSKDNLIWIENVAKSFLDSVKAINIVNYKHWQNKSPIINIDYESAKLSELASNKDDFCIFAKSAGCLVALNAILKYALRPGKCVFIGFPLNWAVENSIKPSPEELFSSYSVKTLFIQKEADPICPAPKLNEFISKHCASFSFCEIPGSSHHYEDLQLLKSKTLDFINS